MRETQLDKALRVAIDQGAHPELLDEPAQLARRGSTLREIHEMHPDAALREEPLRLARSSALLRAEDLYFHRVSSRERGSG
jgi:hypothetical protein